MNFAVIDTETTWDDQVMSIGVVIANGDTKREVTSKYYIISPEFQSGGMFSNKLNDAPHDKTCQMTREDAIKDLMSLLDKESVDSIFAYNANFDYKHLPELGSYNWIDIMKIAAYRQYNKFIPSTAECCSTGRLKSGYGVEEILSMMIGYYNETHNAYYDAVDELRIIELLGLDIQIYRDAIIN